MDCFDIEIKNDNQKREDFIRNHFPFIRKEAMRICKRSLYWENDDELSIALEAFNEAIESYDMEKGKFLSFARMIIKRRLIDYFRKESKHPIISIDDTDDLMSSTHPYEIKSSIKKYDLNQEKQDRIITIQVFDKKLKEYDLSFSMLVRKSPKHSDTRNELITEAHKITTSNTCNSLLNDILQKGKISPSKVANVTNLSKKQVKSWKEYILALIIIFNYEELSSIKNFLGFDLGGDDR